MKQIDWEVLANYFIDRECDLYSIDEAIRVLIDAGLEKDQIISLNFDKDFVDYVWLDYWTET